MLINVNDWNMVSSVDSRIEEDNIYTISLPLLNGDMVVIAYNDRKRFFKDNTEMLSLWGGAHEV